MLRNTMVNYDRRLFGQRIYLDTTLDKVNGLRRAQHHIEERVDRDQRVSKVGECLIVSDSFAGEISELGWI